MATKPEVQNISQTAFRCSFQNIFGIFGDKFSQEVIVQLSDKAGIYKWDPPSVRTTSNASSANSTDGNSITVGSTPSRIDGKPCDQNHGTGDLTITVTNQQGGTSTPSDPKDFYPVNYNP
jgi:hypothetical protein